MTIYALGGRRAIPVETVPADRRGRFRYRYRFRSISGRTRFSFQAVVKAQPNYPYAAGRVAKGEREGAALADGGAAGGGLGDVGGHVDRELLDPRAAPHAHGLGTSRGLDVDGADDATRPSGSSISWPTG